MEHESSLLCLQEPTTGAFPETVASIPKSEAPCYIS